MSIAVSAVIHASFRLRLLQAGFGCASLAAGLAIGAGWAGPFHLARLLALACLLAAVLLLAPLAAHPKPRRIDISGLGQIRLTVQQNVDSAGALGAPVDLLDGSTLWPRMLVLRLGGAGAPSTVLVLPDTLDGAALRQLHVACADIASRNKKLFENNKIL